MDAVTCSAYSRPSAISCDSLMSMSCRAPVAGLTAQPTTTTATSATSGKREWVIRFRVAVAPSVPTGIASWEGACSGRGASSVRGSRFSRIHLRRCLGLLPLGFESVRAEAGRCAAPFQRGAPLLAVPRRGDRGERRRPITPRSRSHPLRRLRRGLQSRGTEPAGGLAELRPARAGTGAVLVRPPAGVVPQFSRLVRASRVLDVPPDLAARNRTGAPPGEVGLRATGVG